MKSLDSKTQFARKPAPFGSIRKVPPFEGQRWPDHPRRAIQTNLRRDWTHEDDAWLDTLLDQGLSYAEIARKLRRASGDAVRTHLKRRRIPSLTRRYAVLSARQVAQLLGKRCLKSVVRWIDMGWLPARAAGRIWRISWDALMAFLYNERYWMAWDAARITDPDLRAEMLALRVDAPRWLTQTEVARRYCVISNTVWQWIEKGFLPAMRYGNWYIREDALLGWMPPCERSKAGIPKSMGRAVVGNSMIVARPL
jgi:helix-turn-helix protein